MTNISVWVGMMAETKGLGDNCNYDCVGYPMTAPQNVQATTDKQH